MEADPLRELIFEAAQLGYGITIEPWRDQWKLGYLRGMGGGDLTTGLTLDDAAASALEPLRALGQ